MNFQLLNKQRKFILIAAAVGVISVFLPWITISAGGFLGGQGLTQSANGFKSWGIMVFIAFAAVGIISIMGAQQQPLEKNMWMITLGAGALAILGVVIVMGNASGSADGGLGLIEVGYGIGIYLALAAALGVLGAAWFFKSPGYDLKSGLDSLRSGGFQIHSNPPSSPSSSRMDELGKLADLRAEGKISQEEYDEMKAKIM